MLSIHLQWFPALFSIFGHQMWYAANDDRVVEAMNMISNLMNLLHVAIIRYPSMQLIALVEVFIIQCAGPGGP